MWIAAENLEFGLILSVLRWSIWPSCLSHVQRMPSCAGSFSTVRRFLLMGLLGFFLGGNCSCRRPVLSVQQLWLCWASSLRTWKGFFLGRFRGRSLPASWGLQLGVSSRTGGVDMGEPWLLGWCQPQHHLPPVLVSSWSLRGPAPVSVQ